MSFKPSGFGNRWCVIDTRSQVNDYILKIFTTVVVSFHILYVLANLGAVFVSRYSPPTLSFFWEESMLAPQAKNGRRSVLPIELARWFYFSSLALLLVRATIA